MTEQERWDCGRTLLLESLLKPDDKLRGCAFNQGCKDELLAIRDEVVEMVREMKNPYSPKLEFGKKNDHIEPTISTPNGDISETLMSGTLGDYYMSEKREY